MSELNLQSGMYKCIFSDICLTILLTLLECDLAFGPNLSVSGDAIMTIVGCVALEGFYKSTLDVKI